MICAFAGAVMLGACAAGGPAAVPSSAAGGADDARAQLQQLAVRAESAAPFDRSRDFGGWSSAGGTPACLDVRGQVLAAESVAPIATSPPRAGRCRVTAGRWIDPYTGAAIASAAAVDVDHVVPLKEAWRSGAWAWPRARRRAYANDVRAPDHLVAAAAAVNRSKGDQDPAHWMPPAAAFACHYLYMWVGIKARWGLSVDPAEQAAIAAGLARCR